MSLTIKRVQYFYVTLPDQPGEAYTLLNMLADRGINQLAFSAVPIGPNSTQLALFPEEPAKLIREAELSGMNMDGPHHALLIQGDDELGALAKLHQQLYEANINVYATSGVTDGRGSYGYLIYVKADDYDRAAEALGV
ncbi:hypothetical protein [Desulfogranum japonicum]|uniref:hypothetical protein n=1 Tax=Desulfogranum japonicum TaxID=231447 RepID=UPI0004104545|nr:hypothetical protein [Desulfogranum japonicum]